MTQNKLARPFFVLLLTLSINCAGKPIVKKKSAIFPKEVSAFILRRDDCDHFRGEEAKDDQRASELKAAMEKSCKGTDAELSGLKMKYETDKRVMQKLKSYEDDIE